MARNIAIFGKQQSFYDRRIVTGMTASRPKYVAADTSGNKEFVVDVFLGPTEAADENIVRAIIIAPYARNLVTDVRQPVLLERSKQGQYTVIGRAKILPGGALGDVDDPSYRFETLNLGELRLRHIADLDYILEPLQDGPLDELQDDPEEPLQVVRAFDAFGNQVLGPEVAEEPHQLQVRRCRTVTVRQIVPTPAKLGPKGDPEAMDWGVSELQPFFQKIVEQETSTCP